MFLRLTTSTLALATLTAPVFALTPEELWTTWSAYYANTGYEVSEGTRDLAGETLTLTDVTLKQESAPGEVVTMTLPELVMTGTGDGGVRSTFGQGMKIVVLTRDADDEPVTVNASMTLDGAEVVSTGDAAAHTDTLTAPTMVATLDSVDLPGDDDDLKDVGRLTVTDLTGTSTYAEGGRNVSSDSRAAKAEYSASVPGEDGTVTASGSISDIEATGDMVLPAEGSFNFGKDMAAALRAGATLSGMFKFGAGDHKFDFKGTDEDGAAQSGMMTAREDGVEMTFQLDQAALAAKGVLTGLDYKMTGTEMPLPIAYQMAESTFDIQMPVLKSDTPQPMKFVHSVKGLILDEAIWASFDPEKKLPRDPANLDVDLTGKLRLKVDLFDPEQMKALTEAQEVSEAATATPEPTEAPAPDAQPEAPATADPSAGTAPDEAAGANAPSTADTPDASADADSDMTGTEAEAAMPMPFDVTELTLNRLALSGAGVKAEADGAVTVPEGKTLAEAVGSGKARIEGVNTLLDTLVAMGVIGADEVTGYRMMLTMFTKAGEGDVLTSEVEMKEGGELVVNGQKIR